MSETYSHYFLKPFIVIMFIEYNGDIIAYPKSLLMEFNNCHKTSITSEFIKTLRLFMWPVPVLTSP